MIANVLMWTEFAQRISKKAFQSNSWLVDWHEVWIWSWGNWSIRGKLR